MLNKQKNNDPITIHAYKVSNGDSRFLKLTVADSSVAQPVWLSSCRTQAFQPWVITHFRNKF